MHYSQKPYEIKFEHGDYLYAKVRANRVDREIALAYLTEVAKEAASAGLDRILLDRDIPELMSDADNYLIILDMLEMVGNKRVAIIIRQSGVEDRVAFFELVSENRQAPYCIFRDRATAERWLMEGEFSEV